jgi:hypothetical protein
MEGVHAHAVVANVVEPPTFRNSTPPNDDDIWEEDIDYEVEPHFCNSTPPDDDAIGREVG